ncbi:MAG: beta-ketoacyl synthase N-terminal-like domain-containing protein, partial [Alphaproteobacteria bacterium]
MPGSEKFLPLSGVSPIKLALLAQKARAEGEAILRADPIAIVGMGCRFPGAENPDAFWRLLRDGVDAVSEVPADRWSAEAFYDPDPAAPGKSVTRSGGFLPKIDSFDAEFFGILRREAERMDPQQRLFLEVATEALDHAGLPRDRLAGSRTGVFIASYHSDYAALLYQDLDRVDARTLTGSVHSVLANRLSYLLDLRGPSISIDTACSSSLVAVHLACQSLRYGESDVALAGGVSLMVTPDLMVALSKVGFMAPDGRCKTFDASADGFGRAEGCGVVVLKRFADAIADGDRVLALIRGSAVNQDGHSTVLSAPNGLAQQALIREALTNAQLAPGRIGFVEAHGTGTPLGDPIEVEALAATVGQIDERAGPCFIGAAKANLGHMEAAAGVGGLIKSVLVLQNEAVPPQVHFKSPNPHFTLEGTRLQVPTKLVSWPSGAVPRCIGTSGFGVGGTNAHVILEEAPRLGRPEQGALPDHQILPLSAQSIPALRALAQRWTDFLQTATEPHATLCAAAAQRRSHFGYRWAVTGSSVEALRDNLRAAMDTMEAAPPQRRAGPARTAFIFCGQGSQWAGMGRELLAGEPMFRNAVVAIDTALRSYTGWSLIEELEAPEERSRLQDTEVAQPAIFAIQVGLAALWESWGVIPDAVAGHSVGEIAAFHIAGILSLDDAVRIVWRRAQAMQAATGLGGMAAVALSEKEAAREILSFGDDLSVAAVNAPRSVVLSGRRDALDAVVADLSKRGVSCRPLLVNYAFHSAQMTPFAEQLTAALAGVTLNAPRIPVYSTVTGAPLAANELDIDYFGRNIRQPVRFADAATALLHDGFGAFVEMGPHPVLSASLAEIQADAGAEAVTIASLRRGRRDRETMLQAAAALYGAGVAPDWQAVQGGSAEVVDLPAYPWQRQRYWIETHPSAAPRQTTASGASNILGIQISSPGGDIFEASWPSTAPGWLADHRVGGRIVVPGAAMLDALWRVGREAIGHDGVQLADFIIHHPLVLLDGETSWQTSAALPKDGQCEVCLHQRIESLAGGKPSWRLIASANVSDGTFEPRASSAVHGSPLKLDYDAFARLGVAFGDAFRTVTSLTVGVGAAEAHLAATVGATRDGV